MHSDGEKAIFRWCAEWKEKNDVPWYVMKIPKSVKTISIKAQHISSVDVAEPSDLTTCNDVLHL